MDKQLKLNGTLIISLGRAMQHIHQQSEQMFRHHGLTMAQFTVLEALFHKGPLTIKQITQAVLSTGGNITVVVRNLEERGYVRRNFHPQDKRSFLIEITKEGAEKLELVFALHMGYVAQALTPLTGEEKQQVISILKKIKE